MEKTLQTFRYLSWGFGKMTIIALISIVGSLGFMNLILYITDQYDGVQNLVTQTAFIEFNAAIFALITGLILFLINLRVALANGVSRRTFLIANLPAAVWMAAALALINILLILLHRLILPIVLISQLAYPEISWTEVFLLQFALYFFSLVAGWFITLAYYRSSTAGRWAISLAPFLLIWLYLTANAQSGGAVSAAFRDYLSVTMRSSALIASATLLLYSAGLYGLVYLLIRRAPVS